MQFSGPSEPGTLCSNAESMIEPRCNPGKECDRSLTDYGPAPGRTDPRRVSIAAGEWRSDVAEDQCVVILSGLVAHKPGIAAAHRTELVFSSIGDPGLIA